MKGVKGRGKGRREGRVYRWMEGGQQWVFVFSCIMICSLRAVTAEGRDSDSADLPHIHTHIHTHTHTYNTHDCRFGQL